MKDCKDQFSETRFDGTNCYLDAHTTDNHAIIHNEKTHSILAVTKTDNYMIFEIVIPKVDSRIYYKFVNLPIFVILGVEDPKPPKNILDPIYSIRQSSKRYIGIKANISCCEDKLEINDYYNLLNDIQDYFMNINFEISSVNNSNNNESENCCNCCEHCNCENSDSQFSQGYLGNIYI